MRSVRLPYKRQGLIYFICLNFDTQPPDVRERVRLLCREVGGEHSAALLEVLRRGATGALFSEIAKRHFVDETWLYRLRRKVYELF